MEPTPDDEIDGGQSEIECRIETLVHGRAGLARTELGVIFVPGTAPGDRVRARLTSRHRDYAEAHLVEILDPSPDRREPPCPHVGPCGGCPWQHVREEAQRAAKESALRRELRRARVADEASILPIVGTNPWRYRHRLTLRVDDQRRLGFYQARTHSIVEIGSCHVAEPAIESHLSTAREWLARSATTVRRLQISSGKDESVAFSAEAEGPHRDPDERHETFLREHPTVSGIAIRGRGWSASYGDPRVTLEITEGIEIEAEGGAFTQVSREGNLRLIEEVLHLGAPKDGDRALDLYCGIGNLTLPLARSADSTVGVDSGRAEIRAAARNAERAGISHCRFRHERAGRAVRSFARGGSRFSLVVLDPPRSGARDVVASLPDLRPDRIVYVSCSPPTLARDLRILADRGYRADAVQPIDLFPQTHHLEVVARLVPA